MQKIPWDQSQLPNHSDAALLHSSQAGTFKSSVRDRKMWPSHNKIPPRSAQYYCYKNTFYALFALWSFLLNSINSGVRQLGDNEGHYDDVSPPRKWWRVYNPLESPHSCWISLQNWPRTMANNWDTGTGRCRQDFWQMKWWERRLSRDLRVVCPAQAGQAGTLVEIWNIQILHWECFMPIIISKNVNIPQNMSEINVSIMIYFVWGRIEEYNV